MYNYSFRLQFIANHFFFSIRNYIIIANNNGDYIAHSSSSKIFRTSSAELICYISHLYILYLKHKRDCYQTTLDSISEILVGKTSIINTNTKVLMHNIVIIYVISDVFSKI